MPVPLNNQVFTAPGAEGRQCSLEAPVLIALTAASGEASVQRFQVQGPSVIVFQHFIDPEFKS